MGAAQAGQGVDMPKELVKRKVKLVATPIGPTLPEMLQAYHTSVLVGETEYSFGPRGIDQARGPASHGPFNGRPAFTHVGNTTSTRTDMLKYLRPHFMPGTYDLLRKNCNSFTDCCLSFLLDKRLEDKYRAIEKIGAITDKHTAMIRAFTGGGYMPNPAVEDWQSNMVVQKIKKQVWRPQS